MNNYIILKEISSGGFGKVVKAHHRYTKTLVAIKIESGNINTLKYESSIYRYLNKINNIPKLKDYFIENNIHYLVQELLDFNLKYYKQNIISLTPTITYINIIWSLISILHDIHNLGIIHRDIKPENICFKNDQIYLIDFGLAKKILYNNNHIDIEINKSIIGTPNYISLNIVNGIEPSRRDDLESLIYILIYLLLDENKLYNYNTLNIRDKKDINKIIHHFTDDNIINIIVKYLTYCRNLNFSDTPDYNFLRKILDN